jgi:hypothetical protein
MSALPGDPACRWHLAFDLDPPLAHQQIEDQDDQQNAADTDPATIPVARIAEPTSQQEEKTIRLHDYTSVAGSRYIDSHLIFNSRQSSSFIGVEFRGSTYFTVDGSDYRTAAALMGRKWPSNVCFFGNKWRGAEMKNGGKCD